jgi:hypothetical protein
MPKAVVAANPVQFPIVFHAGKHAQPIKPGQTNVFKVKAGERYRITKARPDAEQLLDNVVSHASSV